MPRSSRTAASTDLTRMEETVLYIAERSRDDPRYSAVKLNHILFYADFEAYRVLGHSITGATYQHLAQGPAPKELVTAKRNLQQRGDVSEESRPYLNRVQKRLVPSRSANLGMFHPEELLILDRVIGDLWLLNGAQVSDFSQGEWGWRLTKVGETIPYESAWLSAEPLSQEQITAGVQLWKERHRTSE